MINLDLSKIVFIDAEIELGGKKILDIGAVKGNRQTFHSTSLEAFSDFLRGSEAVGGHNILKHDLKYLEKEIAACGAKYLVDTLYLSPLLFPKKPYHRLVKDDKLVSDELNNPLNDAQKAQDLFYSEVDAFDALPGQLQEIYAGLLSDQTQFEGFFALIGQRVPPNDITALIRAAFSDSICANAAVQKLVEKYPVELAYALSLISVIKCDSQVPPWVLKNYPRVENILNFLRSRKCPSCAYCDESLDENKALKRFFHYPEFRSYDGAPLQKNAVKAAVAGQSILAVFPTGGGKSITFQLPALMAGENEKGLTVAISPLQSLMKDQTDNLERQHNITDAVTINGSLDPLDRAKAFERVEEGSASLLYIAPESLRSKSIERLLLGRNVVRFVIDEAHCFSSWGQDFRVDYLYIGDFIRGLQAKKDMPYNIPVSCFTATAKQQVIEDIQSYFRQKLSLELEVFRAGAARVNLSYHIFTEDSPEKKDMKLRQLLCDRDCPTIVYVSRTKRAEKIAEQLTASGFPAKAYHGKMEKRTRTANQEDFMRGEVKIIVATTAFGMGVDKKDVGMVIHYDISDSLENYLQEAGRAGRDEKVQADCYVLYADEDLNKHFLLLNQTKLSQKEIGQIWKALRMLTKYKASVSQSALEIARAAGWDDSVSDMETRVKTAINALEQSGFIKRGQNMPRIFADSIMVHNMEAARKKIDSSARFDDASRTQAVRIMSSLFSAKSKARGKDEEGEARIDYLSDRLGIVKEDVVRVIGLLRQERILADAKDLVAHIDKGARKKNAKKILTTFKQIESFLFGYFDDQEKTYNLKEMNEALGLVCADSSIQQLTTSLNYLAIKRLIKRRAESNKNYVTLKPYIPLVEMRAQRAKRCEIAEMILDSLYTKALAQNVPKTADDQEAAVEFSVLELKEEWDHNLIREKAEVEEIEDALYYLLKIGAVKIEGGFLAIYNAMRIDRLEQGSRTQYRKEHYAKLEEYYQNKQEQIHIVGEYAKRLIDDYSEALAFVEDYFVMEYRQFLNKYFKGRLEEISRNMTPEKFRQLFGELSPAQLKIIKDRDSNCIVVAAGPGSGKTKLLTHKLASLYMMEDVKHEQMLMLTFSRASATEFKLRLRRLIGNAANFIQITTFHSYCFDLLGKVGNLEKSDQIVYQTIERIRAGEVDLMRLTKTVLVIDEAQDMSQAEYALVKTLMEQNNDLRIIAVGDDDQNIYEFRGSNSKYFESLAGEAKAAKYELVDNYRSQANLVDFANKFAGMISHRFKINPIAPVKKENGFISIHKLASDKIEIPLVNAIIEIKPQGRTCIVTRTNEEALNILGLLQQEGFTARQIQSNNDFNLYNLAELRDFVDKIDAADSYTISDEAWQKALAGLRSQYAGSDNLQGVLKLLDDFAQSNNKTKYKTDLRQFIRESKIEDFVSSSVGTMFVSTIHQTKGREFDHVFLALSRFPKINDETRRAIYVAITRARQSLRIFYNGSFFDALNVENISRFTDETLYPEPSRICLQLSYKDVYLNHFACCQREIGALISGQALSVRDTGCFWGDKAIVKFSENFVKRINDLNAKGYILEKSYVRFVVFWKGKSQEKEIKVVLPNIELSKRL